MSIIFFGKEGRVVGFLITFAAAAAAAGAQILCAFLLPFVSFIMKDIFCKKKESKKDENQIAIVSSSFYIGHGVGKRKVYI